MAKQAAAATTTKAKAAPTGKAKAKPAAKAKAAKAAKPAKAKATKAKATTKAKPVAKAKATTKVPPTKAAPARKPTAKAAPAKPRKPAPTKPATRPATPSAAFTSIVATLGHNPGIATARMFGHHGLALAGRFFAFDHDGELVVKLAPERVAELASAGVGAPFDPGMGRPSKGWLSVPPRHGDWQRLAEEALAYSGTLPPK